MSETTDQELISIGEETIPFYEDRFIVQLGEDGEIYLALRQRYLRQGYDEAWIRQRQITIETRNQLTDEWKNRGVQGKQYGLFSWRC